MSLSLLESKLVDKHRTSFIKEKLLELNIASNKTIEYIIPLIIQIINERTNKENTLKAAIDTIGQFESVDKKLTKEEVETVFNESLEKTFVNTNHSVSSKILEDFETFRSMLESETGEKLEITIRSDKSHTTHTVGKFSDRLVEIVDVARSGEALLGTKYSSKLDFESALHNFALTQNFLEIHDDTGKCPSCKKFTSIDNNWCQECSEYLLKSPWSQVVIDYDNMRLINNSMGTWANEDLIEAKYLGKLRVCD